MADRFPLRHTGRQFEDLALGVSEIFLYFTLPLPIDAVPLRGVRLSAAYFFFISIDRLSKHTVTLDWGT